MNPKTIAAKLVRLTPAAKRRLRNAGLTLIFMVRTPSEVLILKLLPVRIVSYIFGESNW
jgi:hypothetical protein